VLIADRLNLQCHVEKSLQRTGRGKVSEYLQF
jgi:hypothetical protein